MPAAGVINLYKPTGVSSAQYVYRLRRLVGERRVGHAGSLDPFADGVLLGCVGAATKLVERLMELPKEYETILQLGVTSATNDPESPPQEVPGAMPPTLAEINAALADLIGVKMQVPHAFSSIKVGGRSAYHSARKGESLALTGRPVRIDRAEVISYEWPTLGLRIACGRGVYIRSIARDLGTQWKCGAVCLQLRRTRVGPFTFENGVLLENADPAVVLKALLDVEAAKSKLATYMHTLIPPLA